MRSKRTRMVMLAITLLSVIAIILYPLILNIGLIKNKNNRVPTGNVDIFEIDCDCKDENGECITNIDKPAFNEEDKKPGTEDDKPETDEPGNNEDDNKPGTGEGNPGADEPGDNEDDEKPGTGEDNPGTDEPGNNEDDNKPEIDEDKPDMNDFFVSDNYTMWGNEPLRIFSNPSYEYTSKIAPGSTNSYTFVIKNNTNFDVMVDFDMTEENPYKVNMQYRLKNKEEYIVGDDNTYEDISKLQLKNVKINAKESVTYVLDWKWIDSANDTVIGETIDADYKLTIMIGANQLY